MHNLDLGEIIISQPIAYIRFMILICIIDNLKMKKNKMVM